MTVLLLVLLVAPAHGQSGAVFDPHLAANVYASALAFMAPRTLEPVAVSQLTLWGLGGLTALDPTLDAGPANGKLRLISHGRVLAELPAPPDNNIDGWATAASQLALVAVNESLPVRRAGMQGIVQSFFDEMFNHLDPYSRYVGPRDAEEDRENRAGRAGAGLTLASKGASVLVAEAIADGPGAVAGIRPGDAIIAVDGQSTRGKDAQVVANWIAGPEQTNVTVSWRGRDGRLHAAELERAMVPPETVYTQHIGDTLQVQVTEFNRTTGARIAQAIEDAFSAAHPPDGIVLDLRGNRGGVLRQAIESADALLPAGVVAITAGRDPEATRIWRSNNGELAQGTPVVVLVDGRTASAAEILAAALADRGRAVVVGSSTLGKGLVQTISPLPDGGELFVTWSRVLAPLGWPIQGLGVLPQVCTSLGRDVLAEQLGGLAEGRQSMAAALEAHRSARAPIPPERILAIRNACPAAEGRDADTATAKLLIRDPAAYAAALFPPMRDVQAPIVSGQKGP